MIQTSTYKSTGITWCKTKKHNSGNAIILSAGDELFLRGRWTLFRSKIESENVNNPKFHEVRKGLINNIFDYGDSLSLRNITLQVAIVYVEKLIKIWNIDILNKDISLWSIAILSLAAKYIELDDNVPRISELKEIVESKVYSRTIFVKCEKYLLRVFDWNLVVITPLHFASCILNYCVLFGDDNIKIIDHNGKEAYRFVSNIEFEYEVNK